MIYLHISFLKKLHTTFFCSSTTRTGVYVYYIRHFFQRLIPNTWISHRTVLRIFISLYRKPFTLFLLYWSSYLYHPIPFSPLFQLTISLSLLVSDRTMSCTKSRSCVHRHLVHLNYYAHNIRKNFEQYKNSKKLYIVSRYSLFLRNSYCYVGSRKQRAGLVFSRELCSDVHHLFQQRTVTSQFPDS